MDDEFDYVQIMDHLIYFILTNYTCGKHELYQSFCQNVAHAIFKNNKNTFNNDYINNILRCVDNWIDYNDTIELNNVNNIK